MIRGYKPQKVLDMPSENCTISQVSKDGKHYIMHEFEQINESDEYSFKIRKKLSKCSHIIQLVEEFEEKDTKYFISEYTETDLLKLAHSRAGHVLQLQQALTYFSKLIEVIEEIHSNKLIYRNIRPEKIRIKDN